MCAPQLVAERIQLLLELALGGAVAAAAAPLDGRHGRLVRGLALDEAHEQRALGPRRGPERPDREPDRVERPAAPDAAVDRHLLVPGDRPLHRRA